MTIYSYIKGTELHNITQKSLTSDCGIKSCSGIPYTKHIIAKIQAQLLALFGESVEERDHTLYVYTLAICSAKTWCKVERHALNQ